MVFWQFDGNIVVFDYWECVFLVVQWDMYFDSIGQVIEGFSCNDVLVVGILGMVVGMEVAFKKYSIL